MRILLQSFESGLYLDTGGNWTSISDLARAFANTRQAAEFKIHHRLAGVFVVVLPDPPLPVSVPGTHGDTIRHALEPSSPVGRQVRAVQAAARKEGRPTRRVSAAANHQRDSNRQPCNVSA
jgi:hypothetical protein